MTQRPAPHVAAAIARGQRGAAQAKAVQAVQAKPAVAAHVAAGVSAVREPRAAQAKAAAPARASAHVDAGIAVGRGGGAPVQAKPAHPPGPRPPVVQRMEEEKEDPYARKFGLYDFKRISKSPRLRQKDDERRRRIDERGPYYREKNTPKKKRMWNGKSRPQFDEDTWQTMLGGCGTQNHITGITVYQCNANLKHLNAIYVPRYKDLAKLKALDLETHFGKQKNESKTDFLDRANVITLDHKTQWKQYILSNAEPDDDGEITSKAAKVAYNDTNNLKAMCQSCNSSKNGKKGVFD
ncbi:MAG TPA: GH-E family nuclease [Thermoanaerobaculia bacterium]|nr:GH-E family nuclease [Thermoanaerobaculia bacterium]